AHYIPGGTIAINGGDPTEVTEVARSFIEAFPNIQVFMDDLVVRDETVEYHWTFTGTNDGPGGTGKSVRISGFEEWTLGDDGSAVGWAALQPEGGNAPRRAHGAPPP